MNGKNWEYGGDVDGEPAKTTESGDRSEALYGGSGKPDGPGHGHIATNDGVNASYVREPGEDPIVDDNPRSSTYTGHTPSGSTTSSSSSDWEERMGGRASGGGGRRRGGRRGGR